MLKRIDSISAVLAAALTVPMCPAVAEDPRLTVGRAHWMAGRYPPTRASLLPYRKADGAARTASVDYMLGTSGCRIAERRAWGADYLDFTLYRYQLSARSRRAIERERDMCRDSATMPSLGDAEVTMARVVLAGATSQGKAGWQVDPDRPAVSYPARVLGTVNEAAIARRLVPLADPDRIAAELGAVAPAGARIKIIGRFAFVTSARHTDADLRLIQGRLDRYISFLRSEFGLELPEQFVAIHLVGTQADLRDTARRLHGLDVDRTTIGYSFAEDLSTVAVIPGTRIGTLFHELFHLATRHSFGDAPQWLDEGMAALFEVSVFEGDRVRGLPNWRGPVLERSWAQRPALADVINAAWFAGDRPGQDGAAPADLTANPERLTQTMAAQFAVARYFALFLQDQQKLRAVHAAVRAIQPEDGEPRAAVRRAVEKVAGPLPQLQARFDGWFQTTGGRGAPPAGEIVEKYEPAT